MKEEERALVEDFAAQIRIEALKGLAHLGFGHVGGAMSIADLIAVLYGGEMNIDPKNPKKYDRDRLVVSKGHAGPVIYAALALKGFFPMEWLKTINVGGTRLPSHCDMNLTPGIDMSTGSLGQGMSTAIGIALAQKLNKMDARTFLVLGDGECEEGQIWEGALFAAQQKISNLIAFIDYNHQQLDGYTDDICALGDLRQKFEDFNWYAQECDGHDYDAILECISNVSKDKPNMIILQTKKGKGCTFAEGVLFNHHMKFTPEQLKEAIDTLEAGRKCK